jgi:DNA end-binding protein Ku
MAFIPEKSVDPLYYDKAYLLAPDKRGAKPYTLLKEALRQSGKCALAKWAWKAKQYVVQIRPHEDGLVLQQLLYAGEVRSLKDLDIEQVNVTSAELQLALQLIEQSSEEAYEPEKYEDEEKKRILAAIDEKIAGRQIVDAVRSEEAPLGGQVIDLMAALQASLGKKTREPAPAKPKAKVAVAVEEAAEAAAPRKGVKRAAKVAEVAVEAPAPKARARK